jgi:hypothetical protein
MEISRPTYTLTFGSNRVTASTIVDIDRTNDQANLFCDLCEERSLPGERFDCIVLTQTLHLLEDLSTAVDNLWNALVPGGVLLVTVPALSRYDPIEHDYWRFTPAGLRSLLQSTLPERADIEVRAFGNAIAGAASFLGLSVEDLGIAYLNDDDASFPVLVGARVHKALSSTR